MIEAGMAKVATVNMKEDDNHKKKDEDMITFQVTLYVLISYLSHLISSSLMTPIFLL